MEGAGDCWRSPRCRFDIWEEMRGDGAKVVVGIHLRVALVLQRNEPVTWAPSQMVSFEAEIWPNRCCVDLLSLQMGVHLSRVIPADYLPQDG